MQADTEKGTLQIRHRSTDRRQSKPIPPAT